MYGKDPSNNAHLVPAFAAVAGSEGSDTDEATLRMLQFIESCIEGNAVVEKEEGLTATVSLTDEANSNTNTEAAAAGSSDVTTSTDSIDAAALKELSLQGIGELDTSTAAASNPATGEGDEHVPADLVNLFDSHYW